MTAMGFLRKINPREWTGVTSAIRTGDAYEVRPSEGESVLPGWEETEEL